MPRALHGIGALDCLVTDAWVRPSNLLRLVPGLRERFHPDLKEARVSSWNVDLLASELRERARGLSGWPLIIARNQWFQRKVVSALAGCQPSTLNYHPTLFSYSYTALEPFRFAKLLGWKAMLGQIDPGPAEEHIVRRLHARHRGYAEEWRPAPSEYWRDWRKECELADCIAVNSQWSRKLLEEEGVSISKIRVLPLAFQLRNEHLTPKKYPNQFSAGRRLRVLFLGQIILRKGVAKLLEAARKLRDQPIEFWMVGSPQVGPLKEVSAGVIRWFGAVTRDGARRYFEEADVFILPTFSDGFGLTQLEALAFRLPVIASRNCGEVVEHGVNGLLLEEPTVETISEALQFCLHNPDQLARFSKNAMLREQFSFSHLRSNLCSIAF